MKKKILVIGGGASGLVAAITAARAGASVTIMEQKSELGKKILVTGNGRCNFTNQDMRLENFYCKETEKLETILQHFSTESILSFFESIGVLAKERNGYLYPITDQASSIRDALVAEIENLNIRILLDTTVTKIHPETQENQIKVSTNKGQDIFHKVIIATGGKSGVIKQEEVDGFKILKSLKHSVNPLSPALVPLIGKGKFYKKLAGIRTDARVTVIINDERVRSEVGEIQLTDYGISGIPIFQISRIITQQLVKKNDLDQLYVEVDFMPTMSQDELLRFFLSRKEQLCNRNMKNFLLGLWKDKLSQFFLYTARIPEDVLVSMVEEEELEKLARIIKTFRIQIQSSKEFSQSQVTAGGIPLSEVIDSLESKFHKNIYFTGEILDIDGICGGYNLHFAWASGLLVGQEMMK